MDQARSILVDIGLHVSHGPNEGRLYEYEMGLDGGELMTVEAAKAVAEANVTYLYFDVAPSPAVRKVLGEHYVFIGKWSYYGEPGLLWQRK